MAALGGGGILYEMCKKAMITKNYKVKHSLSRKEWFCAERIFTMFCDIGPGQIKILKWTNKNKNFTNLNPGVGRRHPPKSTTLLVQWRQRPVRDVTLFSINFGMFIVQVDPLRPHRLHTKLNPRSFQAIPLHPRNWRSHYLQVLRVSSSWSWCI